MPAALIVVAVFVLSHQYTGVRHDGTLYAGEALSRLFPGQYRDDLYFLFGSQGSFTILPPLYARLIAMFGLGAGSIVGMLVAFALYLSATAYLVKHLAPANLWVPCILAVVLGWSIYGGDRIFGYAEAFVTARSFAEPLVLFALGFVLRKRWIAAAAALTLALLIHPLIAVAGIFVAWVCLVAANRRWLLLALAAVAALLLLGIAGRPPFDDLFLRYDDQWLALVEEANNHAFVLRWGWQDYGVIAFNLAVLGFAFRVSTRRELRAVIAAAALAGVGSTLVSALLVDILHNPFFGKLQLWRAEWVMQWVAIAMLPVVLHALWQRGERGRVSACFLAMGWIAPFSVAPGLLAIMSVVLEALGDRVRITKTTTRIVVAVAATSAIAVAFQYEARVVKLGALLDEPPRQIVGQGLAMNVLLFGAGLLLIRYLPRLGRLAPIAALAILIGSSMFWDLRAPWTRTLESYPLDAHIWPGLIESDAKVYWYRDLMAPWVLLGHGNYYTRQQASGAVFSRAMVMDLDKRRKITALLEFQEQICRMMNNLNERQTSCEPDASAVKAVCTDGAIDYVVLQSTLEGVGPLAEFSTQVVENGYEKKFFLYRCSALK